MTVQQMLYTWARVGLIGPNCFQPVATTEGLRAESRLKEQVLRLCRYDRPADAGPESMPVSYGWLDTGQLRFVFRRAAVTGLDAFGRQGNFAAHVLVGPAAELPLDELLAAWDSPAWWNGTDVGDADRCLPAARLSEFPLGEGLPPPPPDLVSAVTAWLLGRPGRLTLACPPTHIIAATAEAIRALPGLADGASLSSYEAPGSPIRLLITGGGRAGASAADVLSLEQLAVLSPVATALSESDTRVAHTLRRLWLSKPTSEQGRVEFTRTAQVIVATASGADIPEERVVALLSDNATAVELMDYPEARVQLARMVLNGKPLVIAALSRLAGIVDDDVWKELGQEVAGLVDWANSQRFDQEFRSITRIDPHVGAAVVAAAEMRLGADPADCRRWPTPLIVHVAARARGRKFCTGAEEELVSEAARRLTETLSLSSPAPWRARVIVQAITEGSLPISKAGRLLVAEPALVAPFVDTSPTTITAQVLRSLPPTTQAALLHEVMVPAQPGDFVALVLSLSSALDTVDVLHLVMNQRSALGSGSVGGWAELVATAVERWARLVLSVPNQPYALEQLVYICGYERRGAIPAWRYLLRSLSTHRPDPLLICRKLGDLAPKSARTAAFFALDVCVAKAVHPSEVSRAVVTLVNGEAPRELAGALITAGRRSVLVGGKAWPAGLALIHVVRLVDGRRLAQKRIGGALIDEQLQIAGEAMVQELLAFGSTARDALGAAILASDRLGRSWLRSLHVDTVIQKLDKGTEAALRNGRSSRSGVGWSDTDWR